MSDFMQIDSPSIDVSGGAPWTASHAVQKAEQNAARALPKINAHLNSEGWQMFKDDEEDCRKEENNDDDNWIALTVKSIDSIKKHEKAPAISFKRKSLNEKIGELCGDDDAVEPQLEQVDRPKLNTTSVKRSRGSRSLIFVLLDPIARARVPLAILALISIIIGATIHQTTTIPQPEHIPPTVPAATVTVGQSTARTTHVSHVQRHSAVHYQHVSAPADNHELPVTVTVPLVVEYGHRHAYQTYR